MDLLSSIRKSGSRGGVNFSWDEVQTSQHRENYLGHSLMAPVGRWQKGRDLNWYAKGDDTAAKGDGPSESIEEMKAKERKEEIRKIKEMEEDALARALGLPVMDRTLVAGEASGSNAISVGEVNRVVQEEAKELGGDEDMGKGKGFGDFVGKVKEERGGRGRDREGGEDVTGGLARKSGRSRSRSRERQHRRHRARSTERRRYRSRSRSGERHKHRRRHDDREERDERRPRSRSVDARKRRHRSRSPDRHRGRNEREDRRGSFDRPRRSRSPDTRERRDRRERARD